MIKKISTFVLLFVFCFSFLFVPSAKAATLYYNAAVDTDWNTLGNWWEDAAFTVPASALPTSSDDVIVESTLNGNSGDPAVVNTITFNNSSYAQGFTITVNSVAIFNDLSFLSDSTTIDGNAIFNDSSFNMGSVLGDAVFNFASDGEITIGDGQAWGYVAGVATGGDDAQLTNFIFEDTGYSTTASTVPGNATFYDDSSNSGIVTGEAVFYSGSSNGGTINGDAVFNDSSQNGCVGIVLGNAVFNNSSFNGQIGPFDCIILTNRIGGNAIFNDTSYNNKGGTINGDATFNNSSYSSARTSVNGNAIFNDQTKNGGTVDGDATFNDFSYNYYNCVFRPCIANGNVVGNATFNDNSYNQSTVDSANFYDSSSNQGTVSGEACFAVTADRDGGSVGVDLGTCSVSLPSTETSSVLKINSSSVVLLGDIFDTGGESNFEVGFDYGLTEDYGYNVFESGDFVRGSFGSIASSLSCSTTYHYRAYSKNYIEREPVLSVGIDYGEDLVFTTPACDSNQVLYGIDGAGTNGDNPNLYTLDPATGNILTTIGSVGEYITGLAFNPLTGVLYGSSGNAGSNAKSLFTLDVNTGEAEYLGVINDGSNDQNMPDLAFNSEGELYGVTNNGILYSIEIDSCNGDDDTECLAIEMGDTGLSSYGLYGNGLAFDANDNLYYFGYGDYNYWQIDPDTASVLNEYIFTNSTDGTSLGAAKFNNQNTLFAARTWGSSPADLIIINQDTIVSTVEDNADMIYISAIAFSPSTPVVITNDPSGSRTEATLEGEITNTGGLEVIERGFEWGLYGNYGNTITENDGPYSLETFEAEISELNCGTTYHYRAYARNSAGIGRGEDIEFTTRDCEQSAGSVSRNIVTPSMPTETVCEPGQNFNPMTGSPCTSFSAPVVPSCLIFNTLREGSRGDEVKCLQQGLNQKLNISLVVDGIFGPKTKMAVVQYQLANGLAGDGVVGPLTRNIWNK